MDWLILTEYAGRLLSPEGLAAIDGNDPLVEQRLLIDEGITRSRAFGRSTNVVHVIADTAYLIEIDDPSASIEVAKGREEYFAVRAGRSLAVTKDVFAKEHLNG